LHRQGKAKTTIDVYSRAVPPPKSRVGSMALTTSGMATAKPRGFVGRKPDAKLRADEQEHHMRRRLEASWHKTTKPRDLTATVNDAAVQ